MELYKQNLAATVYGLIDRRRADTPSGLKPDAFKIYQQLMKSTPISVRRNGLLQTLAFLDSRKNSSAQKLACQALLADLAEALDFKPRQNKTAVELFFDEARTVKTDKHLSLTWRSMEALDWFRRLTNAVSTEVAATPEAQMQNPVATAGVHE